MTARHLTLISIVFFLACNSPTPEKDREQKKKTEKELALTDNFKEGKNIFSTHCEKCHFPPDKFATDAYFFDNIFDRLPKPSQDYFATFIKDSKELRASGDKYAEHIKKQWDTDYEHLFKNALTDTDIQNLIIYIQVGPKVKDNQ